MEEHFSNLEGLDHRVYLDVLPVEVTVLADMASSCFVWFRVVSILGTNT
jgi:hypothetical protein